MISAVHKHSEIPQTWFGELVDVFVLLVLAGVVTAAVIRKVVRPGRFEGSHLGEADFILAMITGVVLTLLCWHAAAVAAGIDTHAGFLSNAFAHAFPSGGPWERIFVWAHLCFIFGFLAYLPHSKHLHIGTAAVNVWFGRTRRRGRLEPYRTRRCASVQGRWRT